MDPLAPLFVDRATRLQAMPESAREKISKLNQLAIDSGDEDFIDRELTISWMSQRTGRDPKVFRDHFDVLSAQYFGEGTTAKSAYDQISKQYNEDPTFKLQSNFEAIGKDPTLGRSGILYNMGQWGRTLPAGAASTGYVAAGGFYSHVRQAFGPNKAMGFDIIEPEENAEWAKLNDEVNRASGSVEYTVWGGMGGIKKAAPKIGGIDVDANKARMAEIMREIDAKNIETMKLWADSPAGIISKQASEYSKLMYDMSEFSYKAYGSDEQFRNTFVGGLVASAGSVAVSAIFAAGGPAGFFMGNSMFFGQAEKERMQFEGADYDSFAAYQGNFTTGTFNHFLEWAFGLEKFIRRGWGVTPKTMGMVRKKDMAKNMVIRGAKTGAEEGMTEISQGAWTDYIASMTYDEGRELLTYEKAGERLLEGFAGFILGSIFGAGGSVVSDFQENRFGVAANAALTQVPMTNDGALFRALDFQVMRQIRTDEEIMAMAGDDAQLGKILVRAANGDAEAVNEYAKRVIENNFVDIDGVTINGYTVSSDGGKPVIRLNDGTPLELDMSVAEDAKLWQDIELESGKRQAARMITTSELAGELERRQGASALTINQVASETLAEQVSAGTLSQEAADRALRVAIEMGDLDADVATLENTQFRGRARAILTPEGYYKAIAELASDADPTTVIEEVGEAMLKVELNERRVTQEQLTEYRNEWYRQTEQDAPEVEGKDVAVLNTEWFSTALIDYTLANRKQVITGGLARWLKSFGSQIKKMLGISQKVKKLQRDGKLNPELEALFKMALGVEGTGTQQARQKRADVTAAMMAEPEVEQGTEEEMESEALEREGLPASAAVMGPALADDLYFEEEGARAVARAAAESEADPVITQELSIQAQRIMEEEGLGDTFQLAPAPDTQAFKDWFGDSKVVNENGSPKVVYHGTGATSLEGFAFDYNRIGANGMAEGAGFYFTDDKGTAQGYAKGMLIDAYLSIQKPMRYDQKGLSASQLKPLLMRMAELELEDDPALETIDNGWLSNYGSVDDAAKLISGDEQLLEQLGGIQNSGVSSDIINAAVRDVLGYDGVVSEGFGGEGVGGGTIYVAFFPEQVKSATANRGTFDPADPDITFQLDAKKITTKPPRGVKVTGDGMPVWNMPKQKTSLPKVINTPKHREAFFKRLDSAIEWLKEDPAAITTSSGWAKFLRKAGVWGEVPMPPTGLGEVINDPAAYVEKLKGGYHGDRTIPNTQESAKQGMDGTQEMREIIGEGKPPAKFAVALHHMWGVLSRMLPPIHQEGMWLRLIAHRPVLDTIQSSIDGNFNLSQKEWSQMVQDARAASADAAGVIGNAATANANAFYLMLKRLNGRWGDVADVYASKNAKEMGRKFWSLDAGALGIKNKVQRFIGLTFGTPAVIMDRWKFVEFWLPSSMEGTGSKQTTEHFNYGETTPSDPTGVYGVYGDIENGNPVLSLAIYEAFETVLNQAAATSPELKKHLGKHANAGGLHWYGWNAIKNEAVGHSSLDLTKDLMREHGLDVTADTVHDAIRNGSYYTEGAENQTTNSKVILENGTIRVERTSVADGRNAGDTGVLGSGAGGGTGQGGSGVDTTFQLSGIPQNAAQNIQQQASAKRARDLQAKKIPIEDYESKHRRIKSTSDGYVMSKMAVPISGRLQRINPVLAQRLRRFEFNTGASIKSDMEQVEGFLEGMARITIPADRVAMDMALKNGEIGERDRIARQYGFLDDMKKVDAVLASLRNRMIKSGYNVGEIDGYFPRYVADFRGRENYYEGTKIGGQIEAAILKAEAQAKKNKRHFSTADRDAIVNYFLDSKPIKKVGPSSAKARTVRKVTGKANTFYMLSADALIKHIEEANESVERANFFGANVRFDKKNDGGLETGTDIMLDDSIGALINQIRDAEGMTRSEEDQIKAMLTARFNDTVAGAQWVNNLKGISYLTTMGQFTSAVTQIGDMTWSIYEAGGFNTARALAPALIRKSAITRDDMGIEVPAAEFRDMGTINLLVNKVFFATGLDYIDRVGKETLVNAKILRMKQQIKDGKFDSKTQTMLEASFSPDEITQIIKDITDGKKTEDVVFVAYSTLADFQPINKSEYPEQYLRMPNGRIIYMLKSFTIKQFESFRREGIDQMINGKTAKEKAVGLTKLMHLAGLFMLMGLPTEWIKDFIKGRNTSMSDIMIDSAWKLFGLNSYQGIRFARSRSATETLWLAIGPPFPYIDRPARDIYVAATKWPDITMKEFHSYRLIPVVGGFIHDWWGAGSDYRRKSSNSGKSSKRRTLAY